MDTKLSSTSTLPWIWVIEALARFKQVDVSVLTDLVKRVPEIADDMGKNVRETVSLRILEEFHVQRLGIRNDVSTGPNSATEVDLSEHCDDVLQRLLREISASNMRRDGPETFKSDIQAFILHKSGCLPKCALEQLKDAIQGGHPILASLKERSGLTSSDLSENRTSHNGSVNDVKVGINAIPQRLEESVHGDQVVSVQENLNSPHSEYPDKLLQDSSNRNCESSKRERIDLTSESVMLECPEGRTSANNKCDSHLHIAKKAKQDIALISQAVGQISAPLIANEPSDGLLERNEPPIVDKCSNLVKVSKVDGLGRSRSQKDGHDQCTVQNRFWKAEDSDGAQVQPNHVQISSKDYEISYHTSVDGFYQGLAAIETNNSSGNCALLGTLNCSLLDRTQNDCVDDGASTPGTQNTCVDEAMDDNEHNSQLNISDDAPLDRAQQSNFPDKAQDDTKHNGEPEMSSDSDGYDDEKIDIETKKQGFLSSQCTFSEDPLATAHRTEVNLCMKCNKGGQLLVCSTRTCPIVVHQSCLGYAPLSNDSRSFYCPFCAYSRAIAEYLEVKKKTSLARKEHATFLGLGNEHQPKLSKTYCRKEHNRPRPNKQQSGIDKVDKQQTEPSESCLDGNLPSRKGRTVTYGAFCVTTEANIQEENMGPESKSKHTLGGQLIETVADCQQDNNDLYCRELVIVHAADRSVEHRKHRKVSHQVIDASQEADYPLNDDREESSQSDMSASNYCMRFRTGPKQYTYPSIPLSRRKKVPWTTAEEDMLKDGVSRFSSADDRTIPWKKILEFGVDVFQKGRTTVDLKDKWRNICKGSPTSTKV